MKNEAKRSQNKTVRGTYQRPSDWGGEIRADKRAFPMRSELMKMEKNAEIEENSKNGKKSEKRQKNQFWPVNQWRKTFPFEMVQRMHWKWFEWMDVDSSLIEVVN